MGKLLGAERVKKKEYYLGGVHPDCVSNDIISFCLGNQCELMDCRLFTSKRCGTQAARITVEKSRSDILETLEWSDHMYVREWNFPKPTAAGLEQPSPHLTRTDWNGVPDDDICGQIESNRIKQKNPPQSKNFNDSIPPYKDNHTHKLNPRAPAFYPISHPPGHNTHPNVKKNTLQTPHRSCNLCVLQFNARSLLPKMPEVIHLASQNPDIIAVTETWLTPQIPNGAIHINGYNLTVRTDRQNNTRGGGTAIYV